MYYSIDIIDMEVCIMYTCTTIGTSLPQCEEVWLVRLLTAGKARVITVHTYIHTYIHTER